MREIQSLVMFGAVSIGVLAAKGVLAVMTMAFFIASPIACMWVAVQIGNWLDMGTFMTGILFLGGIALYISVRDQTYRIASQMLIRAQHCLGDIEANASRHLP